MPIALTPEELEYIKQAKTDLGSSSDYSAPRAASAFDKPDIGLRSFGDDDGWEPVPQTETANTGGWKPLPSQPRNDNDGWEPVPQEPPKDRGVLGDIKAGVGRIVPETAAHFGNIAATLSPEGSAFNAGANEFVKKAEAKGKEWFPETEADKGALRGGVVSGVTQTGTSLAGSIPPYAATFAATAPFVTPVVAHVLAAGASALTYAAAEYNSAYNELKKANPQMQDLDAKIDAAKGAAVEGLGEFAGTLMMMKLFKSLYAPFAKGVGEVGERSVRSVLKGKALGGIAKKQLIPTLGTEVATEIGQGSGETAIYRNALSKSGMSDQEIDAYYPSAFSAGAGAIIPTAVSTLLSAGMAAGGGAFRAKNAINKLQDPNANPQARAKALGTATDAIFTEYREDMGNAYKTAIDSGKTEQEASAAAMEIVPQDVRGWLKVAEQALQNGQPIDVDAQIRTVKTPDDAVRERFKHVQPLDEADTKYVTDAATNRENELLNKSTLTQEEDGELSIIAKLKAEPHLFRAMEFPWAKPVQPVDLTAAVDAAETRQPDANEAIIPSGSQTATPSMPLPVPVENKAPIDLNDEQLMAQDMAATEQPAPTEQEMDEMAKFYGQEAVVAPARKFTHATIAADYFFTGGKGVMKSAGYLFNALAGSFPKAEARLGEIFGKYGGQISESFDDIRTIINSQNWQSIRSDVALAVEESYGNKQEARAIVDAMLDSPTGVPIRTGRDLTNRLDALNSAEAQPAPVATPAGQAQVDAVATEGQVAPEAKTNEPMTYGEGQYKSTYESPASLKARAAAKTEDEGSVEVFYGRHKDHLAPRRIGPLTVTTDKSFAQSIAERMGTAPEDIVIESTRFDLRGENIFDPRDVNDIRAVEAQLVKTRGVPEARRVASELMSGGWGDVERHRSALKEAGFTVFRGVENNANNWGRLVEKEDKAQYGPKASMQLNVREYPQASGDQKVLDSKQKALDSYKKLGGANAKATSGMNLSKEPLTPRMEIAQSFAKMWGAKEVVFLESSEFFNAFHWKGNVFVSNRPNPSLLNTMWHEVIHTIQQAAKSNPSVGKMYGKYVDSIVGALEASGELDVVKSGLKKLYAVNGVELSDEKLIDEIMALVGDRAMGKEAFWAYLRDNNVSLYNKFVTMAREALKAFRRGIQELRANDILKAMRVSEMNDPHNLARFWKEAATLAAEWSKHVEERSAADRSENNGNDIGLQVKQGNDRFSEYLKRMPKILLSSYDEFQHRKLSDLKSLAEHELSLYDEGEETDISNNRQYAAVKAWMRSIPADAAEETFQVDEKVGKKHPPRKRGTMPSIETYNDALILLREAQEYGKAYGQNNSNLAFILRDGTTVHRVGENTHEMHSAMVGSPDVLDSALQNGVIRVDSRFHSIELQATPSPKSRERLFDYLRYVVSKPKQHSLTIEVIDTTRPGAYGGHDRFERQYPKGKFTPEMVIRDIDRFYNNPEELTRSLVAEMRRSIPDYQITGSQDRAYLAAVEKGDMATAQRMVDDAAKAAGYFYHGTSTALNIGVGLKPPDSTGILSEAGRKKNLDKVFFTASRGSAEIYADKATSKFGGSRRVVFVMPTGAVDTINSTKGTEVYAAAAADVKSSDPVTRDDQGNVVPLSERFNEKLDDIRYQINAFHGGPHRIEGAKDWKLDKAGTGEGAAAYGWGAYFASLKDVAEEYRKNLSEPVFVIKETGERIGPGSNKYQRTLDRYVRMEQNGYGDQFAKDVEVKTGYLYHAELDVNDEDLLDWDKPLSEQSAKVKKALKRISPEMVVLRTAEKSNKITGNWIYRAVASHLRQIGKDDGDSQRAASQWLAEIGIPGIRYLDGGSRAVSNPDVFIQEIGGKFSVYDKNDEAVKDNLGLTARYNTREEARVVASKMFPPQTHNYVIFDDKLIKLTHRNDEELFQVQEGAARAMKPESPLPESTREFLRLFSSAGIPKRDMNRLERLYALPFWFAKDHPRFAKVLNVQERRQDDRNSLNQFLVKHPTVLGTDNPFVAKGFLTTDEREALLSLIVESDEENRRMKDSELSARGMSAKQIEAYDAWDKSFKRAWNVWFAMAKASIYAPYAGKSWYVADPNQDPLFEGDETMQRDVVPVSNLQRVAEGTLTVEEALSGLGEFSEEDVADFERAVKATKAPAEKIKKFREEFKKVEFYMPRFRNQEEIVVRVWDAEPNNSRVIENSRHSFTIATNLAVKDLKKKYPGKNVTISREMFTPESMFENLQPMAMERFIQNALAKMENPGSVTEDTMDEIRSDFQDKLFEEIATELNSRGFMQRAIHRGGLNWIVKVKDKNGRTVEEVDVPMDSVPPKTENGVEVPRTEEEWRDEYLTSIQDVEEDMKVKYAANGAERKAKLDNTDKFDAHDGYYIVATPAVIKGYQVKDGRDIFNKYMSGLSGFLSKKKAAFEFFNALKDVGQAEITKKRPGGKTQRIKVYTEPNVYEYARKYVTDMLRNQDKWDVYGGRMRMAAYLYNISGKLSAAAVNLTQNYVSAIPILSRHIANVRKDSENKYNGMGAGMAYHKAMKDIAAFMIAKSRGVSSPNITELEENMIKIAHEKGADTAQYLNEITGATDSKVKGALGKFVHVVSFPFSKAEEFNRKSAMLAMFRVETSRGKTLAEATRSAMDYSNQTHYMMGKANLPEWARSGTELGTIARTSYTFRGFNHNYLLMLKDSIKRDIERNGDNKRHYDVLGMSLAYLAMFGGAAAIPFTDDLLSLLESILGIPFRANLRAKSRLLGPWFEHLMSAGLPGVAGVDLSGSLALGLPLIGETAQESVYGVYGGMYDRFKKGATAFNARDYDRAVEYLSPMMVGNVLRAGRERKEGVTSSTGTPLYEYGKGNKPIVSTAGEAALRLGGFRNIREAEASKELWNIKNAQQKYKDEKAAIYRKITFASVKDRPVLIKELVPKFNRSLIKIKFSVPPITSESIRGVLTNKPDKSIMAFEAQQRMEEE